MVYVVDQSGEVLCIARESGQIYWKVHAQRAAAGSKPGKKPKKVKKKDQAVWSGVILASNRLVLVNSKGMAVTLNPKTGVTRRRTEARRSGLSDPVAADGRLYVVTDDGELVAIR